MELLIQFQEMTSIPGNWLAVIPRLPGAIAHAPTKEEAFAKVQAIALQFLANKLERKVLQAHEMMRVEFREARPEELVTPEDLKRARRPKTEAA